MVGNSRMAIALRLTGLTDIRQCRVAIAPFRMHLEVTEILICAWSIQGGIPQDSHDLCPAQKMPTKSPATLNLGTSSARIYRALDRRRLPTLQYFFDYARGTRTDTLCANNQ